MSNQIIFSKILDFHVAEIKPTVLWDETKKCVAIDTRSKRKGKKRVQKDQLPELLEANQAYWCNSCRKTLGLKNIPQILFFGISIIDKSFRTICVCHEQERKCIIFDKSSLNLAKVYSIMGKLIMWWMYIDTQILPETQLDMDMLDRTIWKHCTGYQTASIHSLEIVVCNWDVSLLVSSITPL